MTPAARVAAAIDVLDQILQGAPAEQTLTNWARHNRYAGSKDRVAVRDHVFDALRCRRSYAAAGGVLSGRGLMIGALRCAGQDPKALFTGIGYAPSVLDRHELGKVPSDLPDDVPEWLQSTLRSDLAENYTAFTATLRHRAPMDLRVNLTKATRIEAAAHLATDGIVVAPIEQIETGLRVLEGARKLARSEAYLKGLVELQDAGAQRVCAALPIFPTSRVLDYCAGGGGKALALAAREPAARIEAWDIAPARLQALGPRAQRADAQISLRKRQPHAAIYDLVVADVPCSGSGTWRRSPDAKWRLTAKDLDDLNATQDTVLTAASSLVNPGGVMAYITCSVLTCENRDRIDSFLKRHPGWRLDCEEKLLSSADSDGFYCACLAGP